MKNFAQSLVDLWKQLGLNQRVSLVVAALAVIGGLVGVVLWSQRPDYQLLFGRLGEKDAAAVISYLESQNVPHEVTAGGSAVLVPASQVYKLRMDLAGKGLPNGDGVGFEIFDKGQFGLSDFVQRTNYMRALQGELARTIVQLQGVRSARVMIVQPENRLLLTEQGIKSTASVFVDIGNSRFEPDQVDSIRHLVANAVQGLDPNEVTVVDNRGHVLSAELQQDPTLGTASSQMRYRQQIEDYFSKKVETMLASVIGPGNAVVRVSAEIDTEATTLTEEKYDPEGQVIRTQTVTEDTNNTVENRSAAGGPVGVSANVPDKAGTAAAAAAAKPASTSEQSRKNHTTTYEINRTTTNITRNPGTVKNLTAAVFIAARSAPAPAAVPKGGTPRRRAARPEAHARGAERAAPDRHQRPGAQARTGPVPGLPGLHPGGSLPGRRNRSGADGGHPERGPPPGLDRRHSALVCRGRRRRGAPRVLPRPLSPEAGTGPDRGPLDDPRRGRPVASQLQLSHPGAPQ